jgi:steroid delta-isomerase
MDEKKARETAQAYLDAYANGDREGLLSLFADDASFTDPVGSPPMKGKQAIAAFWDKARQGGSTFTPELRRVIVCGNEAMLLFTMKVRGAEGGGLDLEVADHFVLAEDGRILEARAFWDSGCMRPVPAG